MFCPGFRLLTSLHPSPNPPGHPHWPPAHDAYSQTLKDRILIVGSPRHWSALRGLAHPCLALVLALALASSL
jgi:hypothetical protein